MYSAVNCFRDPAEFKYSSEFFKEFTPDIHLLFPLENNSDIIFKIAPMIAKNIFKKFLMIFLQEVSHSSIYSLRHVSKVIVYKMFYGFLKKSWRILPQNNLEILQGIATNIYNLIDPKSNN